MTSPERDWDAEFEAITRRLEGTGRTSTSENNATRHLFSGAQAADDGTSTTPAPGTVPGFRDDWRLADPPHIDDVDPGRARHVGSPRVDDDETVHDAFEKARTHGPAQEDDDENGDFIAPDPTPIDASDPTTVIMVGALALGPLWLAYLLFFDRDASWIWWSLATLLLITGFALAVVRQPRSRDEDDDGARV